MRRLLDLFCGAGGCSKGYHDAGFEVTGVDILPQRNYPYTFIQKDVFALIHTIDIDQFDVIHASPPCLRYTQLLNGRPADRMKHPDLISTTRVALQAIGKPYVIENVVGSPLNEPIMLCGAMFGLRVYRHRLFESNIVLPQLPHPRHVAPTAHAGNIPSPQQFYCPVGHMGDKYGAQRAMGIDWMETNKEIANAIPPAYTHWIGMQIRRAS